MMLDNTRWPVPNGSEGLCYVETRVLTRVEAKGIEGFTSFETASVTRVEAKGIEGFMSYETVSLTRVGVTGIDGVMSYETTSEGRRAPRCLMAPPHKMRHEQRRRFYHPLETKK
jgi:hypothetical protein